MLKEFQRGLEPDHVTAETLMKDAEPGDYMRRQPRVDPSKLSYNFEQFDGYSQRLWEAKMQDDEKSRKFYKLVKYVKANASNDKDALVRDFTVTRGFRSDLIEIPEEFKDIDISDGNLSELRRKPYRKQVIRSRSNRDLTGYDAWRSFDRGVLKGGDGRHPGPGNMWLVPRDLVKAFGAPADSQDIQTGSGEYHFEDSNLDAFSLFDYKQTDLYWGLNREDEYYQRPANLRRPLHRRRRKWPTAEEFWASDRLHELRLVCDDQADHRKFRRWLRQKVAEAPDLEQSYDDRVRAKYDPEIDLCHGEWDKPGVINTKMAVHHWDFTDYMTEEERKAYKGELPETVVPPKMFDLSKAERVALSKEELKLKEMEEEAAQVKQL